MSISEKVKKLNFLLGKYVVVGGGTMEARGIRKANDIDIVVTEDLYKELVNKGWKVCRCRCEWCSNWNCNILNHHGGIEILPDYSWGDYKADTNELIKSAQIIDGVPFVNLEELLKWKKAANRDKDKKDIKLIEEFLRT